MAQELDFWDTENPQWYIDFMHKTHPWDEGQALAVVKWLYENDYEVTKKVE